MIAHTCPFGVVAMDTPPQPPLRVALVDDDLMVRTVLAQYLAPAQDMEIVLSTGDAREAIALVEAAGADLVLMDVHMPGLDGIEATAQIKKVAPALPVLVLTTFDEDEHMLGALAAGASGFLLKDIRPSTLVDSIRVAASGGRVMSPRPSQRLVDRFVVAPAAQAEPPAPATDLGLTNREIDVVREVCRASSNRQIARALGLSESTVKSYLSAVMEKLGATSRLEVALRAFEAGLVPPPERPGGPVRT